jgi:hypothetical protein
MQIIAIFTVKTVILAQILVVLKVFAYFYRYNSKT